MYKDTKGKTPLPSASSSWKPLDQTSYSLHVERKPEVNKNRVHSCEFFSYFQLRIITLGDASVGKTTFLQTLKSETCPGVHREQKTLSHVTKRVRCIGHDVHVDVFDTGGKLPHSDCKV